MVILTETGQCRFLEFDQDIEMEIPSKDLQHHLITVSSGDLSERYATPIEGKPLAFIDHDLKAICFVQYENLMKVVPLGPTGLPFKNSFNVRLNEFRLMDICPYYPNVEL